MGKIIYDEQWDVPSDSGHAPYTVSRIGTAYLCSCPAWTRHMPRRDCKHIKRVRAGWYSSRAQLSMASFEAQIARAGQQALRQEAAVLCSSLPAGTQVEVHVLEPA